MPSMRMYAQYGHIARTIEITLTSSLRRNDRRCAPCTAPRCRGRHHPRMSRTVLHIVTNNVIIVPAVAPCVIAPRLVSFDFRYLECLIGASPRSPGSHRRRTSPIRLCLIVFQLVSVLLIVIVSKRGPLDRQLFMIRIQRNSYHRN